MNAKAHYDNHLARFYSGWLGIFSRAKKKRVNSWNNSIYSRVKTKSPSTWVRKYDSQLFIFETQTQMFDRKRDRKHP